MAKVASDISPLVRQETFSMGEIADDMVEGFCCSWCGQYFVASHGFQVLCTKCHEEQSRMQLGHGNELPQATERLVNS